MSAKRSAGTRFRRYFLSGLLVVVPLAVTYLVLRMIFTTLDGILAPLVVALHGKPLPGLGIVATLLLVLLLGFIATGVAGSRLVRYWEDLLSRIPLIRVVYGGARQVVESVSKQGQSSFHQVGLVEYPRKGVYSVCFISNRVSVQKEGQSDPHLAVFIPSTPTPFTGFLILVKPEDVLPVELSVEDAVKLCVSGGIVAPEQFVMLPPEVL